VHTTFSLDAVLRPLGCRAREQLPPSDPRRYATVSVCLVIN